MLRKHKLLILFTAGMALALLTGCGQNYSSTAANELTPTPTATTGQITLYVGASSYHTSDTIEVTLRNAGDTTIYFLDHLTNCTVIQLQQQVNGKWETVHRCLPLIATRWHTLDAGQSLVVKLAPGASNQQWPAGFYRATLSYGTSRETSPLTPIYSAGFQVQ
jgi:ABC-type transport system substrate-binding protein